jgi:hypothetical protein
MSSVDVVVVVVVVVVVGYVVVNVVFIIIGVSNRTPKCSIYRRLFAV